MNSMVARLAMTVVLGCALAAGGCAPAPETAATPEEGSAMPSSVVDPYLRISSALAKDSVEGVGASAGELATAATALGAPAVKINTAAVALAAATQIADARVAFEGLSDAVVAYVDEFHLTLPAGVRVAVCPMKRKPWLQQGEGIENPFYGASMLTCGDFR